MGQVKKINEGQQCSSSDEIEELTPQEEKVVADYCRKKAIKELAFILKLKLLGNKES